MRRVVRRWPVDVLVMRLECITGDDDVVFGVRCDLGARILLYAGWSVLCILTRPCFGSIARLCPAVLLGDSTGADVNLAW